MAPKGKKPKAKLTQNISPHQDKVLRFLISRGKGQALYMSIARHLGVEKNPVQRMGPTFRALEKRGWIKRMTGKGTNPDKGTVAFVIMPTGRHIVEAVDQDLIQVYAPPKHLPRVPSAAEKKANGGDKGDKVDEVGAARRLVRTLRGADAEVEIIAGSIRVVVKENKVVVHVG